MKICKIYLRDFEQFQNVDLDFTHPDTGEPLDKICFIGSNGTGKSKLLKIIKWYLNLYNGGIKRKELSHFATFNYFKLNKLNGKILIELKHNNKVFFIHCDDKYVNSFKSEINGFTKTELVHKILKEFDCENNNNPFWKSVELGVNEQDFQLNHNSKDLVIYCPSESNQNAYKDVFDVPDTSLEKVLGPFGINNSFPYNSEVSADFINTFWELLMFNNYKRLQAKELFENLPENLSKTKQVLINEFDENYPQILEHLGFVWNKILAKAGLYFDSLSASNPFQPADNLKAYIKLKSSNEIVPYGQLSTGIRNYIFRLGHIFSLYFNREIDRGFLLVDEPENSLFPDFLFDLMDTYKNVIIDKRGQNNTQVFFATHNPIVAAQFQPYERIILEWKDDGSVKAKKGFSPIGDDPNDILSNDFELKDLMGPDGMQKWEEYISLKKKLAKSIEDSAKSQLIHEIEKIGSLYNFN